MIKIKSKDIPCLRVNILVVVILLIRIVLAIREFWLARKEKRTVKHSNSQQVILLNQSVSDTFQHLSATIDGKQIETIELKTLNEQSEKNITGALSPKKMILLTNLIEEEESPKEKPEVAKKEISNIEGINLSQQKEKAKEIMTPEKQEPLMKRVKNDQSKEDYQELRASSQNRAPIRLKLPTRTTPMFKDSKKNNAIVNPLNNNRDFEIEESPGVDSVHIQGEGVEVSKDKTEKDVVSIVLQNEVQRKASESPKLTKSILKK